jgi:adenylate kinase family enzyme
VLTGASGAGKTTIARGVEQRGIANCQVHYFDSIGVPSDEQMRAQYGREDGWQRRTTLRWMERIKPILDAGGSVLFEGQMRIAFVTEALASSRIDKARIILVDCDDETREARLRLERVQPELASERMRDWARYLRDEARAADIEVLDTARVSVAECADLIIQYLNSQ